MSIYNSSNNWTCPSVDQSPINLSQTSAKQCDLLCEFSMESTLISQANVLISDEGLILQNTAGLGSCKYNGEGYNCTMLMVNHPSHHTVENIQADAEAIAIFTNPSGKYLCVSSLIRINTTQTISSKFFNAFVSYANPNETHTVVNLGDDWSLNMMVPPNGAHFVYDGSMVVPPCQKVKWVVFKTMINMDSNDFALLVKNVQPGSRPIQPTGDREIFFNPIEKLPGSIAPHNSKTFTIYKRSNGKTNPNAKDEVPPVTKPDIKSNVSKHESSSTLDSITNFTKNQINVNGIMSFVEVILQLAAIFFGVTYGKKIEYRQHGLYLIRKSQYYAGLLRSIVIKEPSQVVI